MESRKEEESVDYKVLEKQELLSAEMVKKWLAISNSTLHRWSEKGTLKKFGIEGRVFYKFSQIIEALTELK